MIEDESMKRNAAKKLMVDVLEKYHSITSSICPDDVRALQQEIAKLPFVPVSSGKPKAPNTLYSPLEPELKDLFAEEPVFPTKPFCVEKHIEILKSCGLKTNVSTQEVAEIICSVGCPANDNPVKVDEVKQTRARAILTYIKKWDRELSEIVCIAGQTYHGNLIFLEALKQLSITKTWLPIQSSPPPNYPPCLSWKGMECNSHLISFGSSVLLHEDQKSLALACGSQMYFVEHSLPYAICKAFEPSPKDMIRHIMAHLERVILSGQKIEDIRKVTHTIYEWLKKYRSEDHTVDLSHLKETQECVWLNRQRKFVNPHHVALKQNDLFQHNLEPFIYILPDDLAQFESLFKDLGVQEIVTSEQILRILSQIKEGDSESLEITSDQAWHLVMVILHWLTDGKESEMNHPDSEQFLVPVQSSNSWPELVVSEDAVYTDNDFLRRYLESSEDGETEFKFVYDRVTPQMSHLLKVTPLSKHLEISEDAFEDVGQSEPLTVRLKNILKDYKDGLTIIKELLQNADDAGATEMNICHDKRYHTDKHTDLFFPGMANCHGPALVVNNDAMFTKEDFVNITKLAGATKEGKSLKIGKFGIGFCSVYHITDIPSFVSSDLLYIFDPTLMYLKDEIKNPAMPGKKVCFTSRFIRRSKQLDPYVGLYGFDPKPQPKYEYEGTTFRFPFRTGESELSENMYTENEVKQLMQQMLESSSKLILFLQKIKSVTFSQVGRGEIKTTEQMRITKCTEALAEGRCIEKITCSVNDSTQSTEYWLVETSTQTVLQKYSTASVACSLSPLQVKGCYKTKEMKGEMFCFLPLSITTGLPVHVSSNFAVISNRRGIWTSDESDATSSEEVDWNVSLMKTVICSAYCRLLEALRKLQCDSKLEEYEFFSMWPVEEELQVSNPWHHCVTELYKTIAKRELFFSVSTNRWLTLEESKFLDPDILRVSYNTPFPSAVLEIINHIELPVVHLPKKYHKHLDLTESIETEKMFLEHFFDSIDQLESMKESRNDILCLALKCYANELAQKQEERYLYLHRLLTENTCVPCAPDGEQLKKASDLIHPEAMFAKLFDEDENVFPLKRFCDDKVFVDKAMKELGMLHDSIPLHRIEERATGIAQLYFRVDEVKAMERAQIIIKCLVKEDERETLSPEKCSNVSHIQFLPVMEKPENYMLQWKGHRDTLHRACDIFMSGNFDDKMTNITLAGSQLVFLNQEYPSKGGCGIVGQRAQTLLQIRSSPSHTDVISHFHHMIDEFDESQQQMIELAGHTSKKVYAFLEKHLASTTTVEPKEIVAHLAEKPFIWTGKKFVGCKDVAQEWSLNGPHLFEVPIHLKACVCLVDTLDIRPMFSLEDMITTLKCVKEEYEDCQLPPDYQELVKTIVPHMPAQKLENDLGPIMLPDADFVMQEAKKLHHNDMPWTEADEEFRYVHEMVPLKTALALGVKRCRSAVLGKYSSRSGFKAMAFGQHEELTRRIQNIIRDYPFDMTILKELLQNADDAKATKMHVILDMRQHSKERLLSNEWSDLQGPALLVWNDSVFTEEDLEGIQHLGLGSKRSDSETIGQYGIGFNAVYHLTDCPSFLTGGDKLCILDPHMRYVEEATERHPGEMYVDLDDNFWRKFAGIKSTYLQEDLVNKPNELLGGTLFRFPLRHTPNHVKESKIVNDLRDSVVLSAEKMHTLLEEWAPSMKQSLLFLNHVTELKFSVIRDTQKRSPGELHLQNAYRTELDETAQKQRLELTRNIKLFGDGNTRKPCIATYSLAIESQLPKKTREKWLIQQGIGDMENSVTKWSYVEQVKPRHGIAAPLKHEGDKECIGQVFCFLPLPLYSGLPVHINGHFILNSTRRNLWAPTDPGREDSKSMWNRNMLQAIAASYAHFLERIHEYFPQLEGCAHREALEESVKEYYACFPRTHLGQNMLSEPWLTLAKQVFQILFARNSPVLAVPTKISSSEDKYLLQWRPPKSRDMPVNQVYFPEGQIQSLVPIFERIGMKITCAPKWIRAQFNEVNCKIPAVSQSSVYDFYIRFQTTRFPRPIQDTPFRGVEDFKLFTKYLLNGCGSFPKEPFGYPLLLTAAEQLCVFDKGNKILCSKHLRMFPSCKSKFLHPDLIECSYSSSYFVSEHDHKLVRLKIVKELLETILPTELKSAQVSSENYAMIKFDMRGLWKCFSDDEVFCSVVEEVLKVWALLLTKDKRLFQCQSRDQLLPIVVDVYPHKAVVSVLEQIRAPILDTSIVPVDVVHSLCPNLNDYKAVLNDLVHFYKEFPFFEVIKKQSAGILIDYFSKIYLRREQYCCQQLKCLPLFEKMDGQFTILHGKTVYVWPINICQEGNELWLSRTNRVFLSPSGAWTRLGVESELGIKRITAEAAYLDFIFPHFSEMYKKDRYHHLKYIRDHLFNSNFASQNSPHNFSTAQNVAYQFIAYLKTLRCIGDDGEAKPVSHFYTHEKLIFQTFPEHFQTLPKDLLQGEEKLWMPFFKNIGLKDSVNAERFVALCTYVAGGKLKERTATGSKILLDFLFSFEEANHHGYHQNLRKISLIPFVCPVPVPEFEWIHKVPATPNRVKLANGEEVPLCTLSGSCLSQHKHLLWPAKSVVEIPYCQNGILQNLGICVKPTDKDLMESISLIAKTCFTNPDLFMKYTVPQCKPRGQKQLMDVMVEIFMHMEQFQVDITQLKSLRCIPVYAILNDDSGQYPVLVEPRCVVFRPARDTTAFYPYVHGISSTPLYKAKRFLERVGVKDSLELEHMQLVLQSAFTVSGSGTIDMEPNTLKVVSSAVVEMKDLLEKNKRERQQMGEEVLVEKLKPLYLSSTDKRMHSVHSLVYSNLHNVDLEGTDLYLLWTPKRIFPASLCEFLPKALRPRSLPELCFSKVSESCKECENEQKHISEIKRSLNFPSLQQALFLAGKSNIFRTLPESKQQKLSEKFQAHIAAFFETLEIHCVENLKVDIFLKDSKITKPVAHEKVKCIIQIEIATQMQQVHHLYIDSNIRPRYVSEVHECVASQLLSCLYGDIRETELDQLNKFMSRLIGAESPEEIYSMLQNKQINATEMDMTIEEPRLGDKVPMSWHYRLDMSRNNIFQSQEWVAYQLTDEENSYIFAQISHPVRLRDSAGEPLPPTHMEYIIFTSEDSVEEKKVQAIDLYKFIRGETAPDDMIEPAPSESQEIVPFEGDAEEVPPPPAPINVQQAREEVRKELEEIWRLPQADRKKAIRRLFFKWHPDKNPQSPKLAEEVFKFIQNELDRLERDDGVSVSNNSGPYQSWRSYWHTWNFYARQHGQYYQQQRRRNRGGGSSGWGGGGGGGSGGGGGGGSGGNWYYNGRCSYRNRGGWGGCWFFSQPFTPPKNEAKAKQWARQATADHTVLQLLLTEAHGNAQVCGSVCFMAHEVAEKALKGAMYATCGLGDKLHASHNIIALANSVELMEPHKARGLSTLAQPLESTYYEDTRFPKESELCPPYEKFTLANAMEAEKCATEILKIVRDNIVNI